MKSNQEYKNAALAALRGNWAPAVVATIVFLVIVVSISGCGSLVQMSLVAVGALLMLAGAELLLSFLIVGPIEVGYLNSFRVLYENGDNKLTRNIFSLGFTNWLHIVWGYFLMSLLIVLWSFLFLIPGIIMAFAYFLTPYILVENPEMKVSDALRKSRMMMKGHKFDLFYLELSFIGWILLGILTLGIGYLWLIPYMYTTVAAFYNDLKVEAETGTVI